MDFILHQSVSFL